MDFPDLQCRTTLNVVGYRFAMQLLSKNIDHDVILWDHVIRSYIDHTRDNIWLLARKFLNL